MSTPFPILAFFEFAHLPAALQQTSQEFHQLAHKVASRCKHQLPASVAETENALRKLLEAKDCAVRAALPQS